MLNDIHKEFYVKYLQPVDQERLLVNTTYKVANASANRVASLSTPSDEILLDSLTVDGNSSYITEEKELMGSISPFSYQTTSNQTVMRQEKDNYST